MKSPITPLFLVVLALYISVRATLDLATFLAPYLYKGAIATLQATKALLKYSFASLTLWGYEVHNYFYPVEDLDTFSGTLDTLLGVLLSDLGKLMNRIGKAGTRICE